MLDLVSWRSGSRAGKVPVGINDATNDKKRLITTSGSTSVRTK
jgi:hypothetical protein